MCYISLGVVGGVASKHPAKGSGKGVYTVRRGGTSGKGKSHNSKSQSKESVLPSWCVEGRTIAPSHKAVWLHRGRIPGCTVMEDSE